MSCSGAYSNAEQFADWWCITITDEEEAGLNAILADAATMLHAARGASGGCNCTLASWAAAYLRTMNNIIAAVFYNCKCTNLHLTPDEKQVYMTQVMQDLTNIRQGNIELCAGETGTEFPVTGWAEQGTTEFAQARIIANDILRNG